jgi:hypothetical protein
MAITLTRRDCECRGTGVVTRYVESSSFYPAGSFCPCPIGQEKWNATLAILKRMTNEEDHCREAKKIRISF